MLIFLDLETTGLADHDEILEVAAIAVDDAFAELSRFHRVLNTAQTYSYQRMDPFVRDMHFKNGLWMESLRAAVDDTPDFVDAALAGFIRDVCPKTGENDGPLLAGNTISFDRRFIRRWMPETEKLLHYRMFDCSTINELAKRAWPALYEGRGKPADAPHRAMYDVEESAKLARYYRYGLAPVQPPTVTVF